MKDLMHNTKWGVVLLLFLLSHTTFAKKADVEKTRTITESYPIDSKQMIELENSFGEMKITSWDKNEVSVNITITVKGSDEKRTQETFDNIKVDIEQKEDLLSIKTKIEEKKGKVKVNTGDNGNLNIDYEIKVPINNRLKAKNSFGPLFIDKMMADVKVELSFGSATIGELFGSANDLTFQFSDPVIINKVEKGKIKLEHSKLELMQTNHLVLASEMSSSMIDKVKQGEIHLKFGSADLNDIQDLRLKSQMSAVQVKKLHRKGILEVKYGSVTLAEVDQSLELLDIESEFSPVKINLQKSGAYQIDADINMGGLKLPSKSVNTKDRDDAPSTMNKTFAGKIGQGEFNPVPVKIRGSFGDVKVAFTD